MRSVWSIIWNFCENFKFLNDRNEIAFPTVLIGVERLENESELIIGFYRWLKIISKMATLGWTRGLISKKITTGRSTVMIPRAYCIKQNTKITFG